MFDSKLIYVLHLFHAATMLCYDACYRDIQTAAKFNSGVKCPRGRDPNKCQIPGFLGLNSCQMPGHCLGGGGGLGMGTLELDSLGSNP